MIYNNIYELISNSNLDNKLIENYIKYNANIIFNDFEFLSQNIINENKNDLIFQKKKNEIIMQELKLLCDYFCNGQIKIIGLKGIFLGLEYYTDYNDRVFTDVDLLLNPEDGYRVYQYLLSNGYSLKKYSLPFYNNSLLANTLKKTYFKYLHHLEFEKEFFLEKNERITLLIEVHFNLNTNLKTKFDCKQMINDSIKKNFENITFFRFSNEDYFIYLCVNICAHIAFIFPNQNNLTIDLQKLNDICYLIKNEEINWTEVYQKSIIYETCIYVGFISKIITALNCEIIPENFLKKIDNYVVNKHFYWEKIYFSKISKENAIRIIFGVYDDYNFQNVQKKIENSQFNEHYKKILWIKCINQGRKIM